MGSCMSTLVSKTKSLVGPLLFLRALGFLANSGGVDLEPELELELELIVGALLTSSSASSEVGSSNFTGVDFLDEDFLTAAD